MPNLLGSAPNQCPTNADLGKLAFMDVVDTVTNNPYLDTAISDTKPSLLLDFANSKALDPRITYTRASTATYYDGKTTAVAEQNLLTYSQEFDNAAWVKFSVSVTANSTTSPDGTTTADSLINDGTNSLHGIRNAPFAAQSAQLTYSAYFKANTISNVSIALTSASPYTSDGAVATFDLTAGTVSKTSGPAYVSSSITSVGNGWYRCSLTASNAALTYGWLWLNSTNNPTYDSFGQETFTGTAGQLVYLWGAQLEQRSSVTAYTPTTSSPITNYIPALQTAAAGVPRFDHDPVTGESKGFLIEEQRSNLMLQSQFASGWTTNNTAITPASIIAPDGTLTGAKAVISAATASSNLYQNITLAANTTVSMSCYVKYAGVRYVNIGFGYTAGVYAGYQFDILNGVVVGGGAANGTNVSASITHVGNGWYRCVYVGSLAYANPGMVVLPSNVAYTSGNAWFYLSLTGNGFDGLYVWGAQLEAGSFATSYIPTTSAQVTRSADAASITGANFSSWYSGSEGSLYVEVLSPTLSTGRWIFSLDNGTASSGSDYIRGTFADLIHLDVRAGGVTQANLDAGTFTAGVFGKLAVGIKANNFAASINGGVPATSSSGNIPSNTARLVFGTAYDFSASNYISGYIKKLAYYPKRLSDAELQEMTQ